MGVEENTFDIPDLVLSDTFFEWFTTTNTSIIAKLNLLEVYSLGSVSIATQGAVVGDGISAGLGTGGELFIEMGSTVDKDITFNGNITVNGSKTTINSTEFTVDDFNLVLGHTGDGFSANDDFIMENSGTDSAGNSAGGGIIVHGSSGDKEFLWKYPNAAWNSNQNIKLASGKALLDEVIIGRQTGVSGANATQGLVFGFTAGTTGPGASGSNATIRIINDEITAGVSSDAVYINDDGYVSIVNGANKITVSQASHGFTFSNVVYINSSGDYVKARADNLTTAEVIGVVSRVYDDNRFELTVQGEIIGNFAGANDESSTLTAGRAYFLSTSTAGNHSSVKTTEDGKIQKAVMIGLGTDRALVTQFIGGEVDQINAAQDATIQNKFVYTQANHGFTFGDAIYIRDTTDASDATDKFRRAEARVVEEGEFDPSDVVAVVEDPSVGGDANIFSAVMGGIINLPSGSPDLEVGQPYFLVNGLSDATLSRNLVLEADRNPVADASVNKPCMIATKTNQAVVQIQRGIADGGVDIDEVTDVPIGTILPLRTTITPSGYLLCDGTRYSVSVYPDLFAALGGETDARTEYDSTDDSFIVPNLSGRFLVGDGTGKDDNDFERVFSEGGTGGVYQHTLTINQMPSHNHRVQYSSDTTSGDGQGQVGNADNNSNGDTGRAVTSTGGGQPHENTPPFFGVKYYIRAEGVKTNADGTQVLGGDLDFTPIAAGIDPEAILLGRIYATPEQVHDQSVPPPSDNSSDGLPKNYNAGDPTDVDPWVIREGGDSGGDFKEMTVESSISLAELLDRQQINIPQSQIRTLLLTSYFDCDGVQAYVDYKMPGTDDYYNISQNVQLNGDGYSQFIPINPGQAELEFRVRFKVYDSQAGTPDNRPLGARYTSSDAASIYCRGYQSIVDNILIRDRRSYTGRKNLLINGNFDIWQRDRAVDAAVDGMTNDYYTADRWSYKLDTDTAITDSSMTPGTIQRRNFNFSQTDVPHYPSHYIEFSGPSHASGASAILGTGSAPKHVSLEQKIEDAATLSRKNMTVSFFAKGSKAGSCFLGYNRRFDTADFEYHKIATFNVDTDWRKYSFTVVPPSIPVGKTITSEGRSSTHLAIAFYIMLRSGQHALPANVSNVFYDGELSIAQVQVEENSRSTEFEIRSLDEELNLAKRYFQTSYDLGDGPSTQTTGGISGFEYSINHTAADFHTFERKMRKPPIIHFFNPGKPGGYVHGMDTIVYNTLTSGDGDPVKGYVSIPQYGTAIDDFGVGGVGLTAEGATIDAINASTKGLRSWNIDSTTSPSIYRATYNLHYTADAEL